MERERERYRRMRAVLRQVEPAHHDNPRLTHRDSTILLVTLWAALHDKPISWATVPQHWPADLRPRPTTTALLAWSSSSGGSGSSGSGGGSGGGGGSGRRNKKPSGLPSQSCMSRRLRLQCG